MERNLPLSPPRRILERLTPVQPVKRHNRYRSERRSTCRSRFYNSSHRTLTSTEVLERVRKWEAEKKNKIQLKKERLKRRMLTAQRNRNAVIEERRETARRFSKDSKAWNRPLIKLDVKCAEECVFENDDQADPIAPRHDDTAFGCIGHHLQRHFLRRRLHRTTFLNSLEDLINSPYGEVEKLVQDPNVKLIITDTLQFYHMSNPFSPVPIENVFLTSLLCLSDHTTNTGEKVFGACLGDDAEGEFGGYLPQWMRDIYVLEKDFMDYLTTRQLVLSRRLLLRFQVCVMSSSHHHDTAHLRLLSTWRSYCDLFRLTQCVYLSRCLLLLSKAIDILESGMAIETFIGCVPEYSKMDLFQKRKNTLVRQLAQWKRRSQAGSMDWCFLGLGLQEKANELRRDFEQYKRNASRVGNGGVLIPPGFSVEEWQKFRLFTFLDLGSGSAGIGKMKTGRDLLVGGASPTSLSDLESMMERIGMMTFREESQGCTSVAESTVLSFKLFACLGIELTNQESEFLKHAWETTHEGSYFKSIQSLFAKYSGISLSCVSGPLTLKRYLHWWRAMMNKVTSQFVQVSLGNLSFGDFAYQMGVFTLKQRRPIGTTLEDYAEETGIRLRYTPTGKRRTGIPVSTLVVEDLLGALHMQRKLPWLFGILGDELRLIYDRLEPIVGECLLFVVGVCESDEKADEILGKLVHRSHWVQCHKWRMLVCLHLQLFL